MKAVKYLKLIIINLLILILILVTIDLILGAWFKNNFSYRLSSERNIHRVYKFDFKNYKGESVYIRDTNAFRVKSDPIKPSSIDIVFTGGSTTNQKFLNYEDTIVSVIDNYYNNINFVNAGVDGLSIVGHINSLEFWFNKIKNFEPKYYIVYLGINDQKLLDNQLKYIDQLKESDFKSNLREYMEANSFFYKKFRYLKSLLYLKYNFDKGVNYVNKKGVVYTERNNNKFYNYEYFEKKNIQNKKYEIKYLNLLEMLTNKIRESGSDVIYITQISGHGMNDELYLSAKTIMSHCESFKLKCINLAKNAALDYEDFYDSLHLNPRGAKKASIFLIKKLNKIINK